MLLLDAYNILHITGVLPPELAGINAAELVELLRLSRYRAQPITLVLDGRANDDVKAGRSGLITIRFSGLSGHSGGGGGSGRSADELIAQLIEQSTVPKRLTVVSSE